MRTIGWLAALTCCLCLGPNATAHAADTHVLVEPYTLLARKAVSVEPGAYVAYHFDLAAGITLVAELIVDGGVTQSMDVLLLDAENFNRYTAGRPFEMVSEASGTVRRVARYSVAVPRAGVYYLVLDNRQAFLFSRTVNLYVYGKHPGPTKDSAERQAKLEHFYRELKRLFVFNDFRITYRHCGFENAFSNPDITFCAELADSLSEQGLGQASLFILAHELAHTLLRQWRHPDAENEDVADEFATIFSLLSNHEVAARTAAQWFAARPSWEEAMAKLQFNDPHTLSPQRARNVLQWLKQPVELFGRWQKVLIPNMQVDVLRSLTQSLDQDEDKWIDHSLIRSELAKRTGTLP